MAIYQLLLVWSLRAAAVLTGFFAAYRWFEMSQVAGASWEPIYWPRAMADFILPPVAGVLLFLALAEILSLLTRRS